MIEPTGTNLRVRPLRLMVVAAALLAAVLVDAPVASADEVTIGGVPYRNVRVTGLRDDVLLYETAAGSRRQANIAAVERIQIDRYPAVGIAEDHAMAQEYAEAAEAYARALDEMREEDLKVLVHAKLVASLEQAGQSEEAVRQYVALLERSQSSTALAAKPQRWPEAAEKRAELATLVRERVNRTADPVARRPLNDLLAALEAEPDATAEDDNADRPANGRGVSLVGPRAPVANASLDAIDQMIERQQYDRALTAVEEAIRNRNGTLARRLHQRGQILAGLRRDRDSALSFMRVVVHYPTTRNPYYLPSLIEGGRVFVRLNEYGHARNLWEEALASANDAATREQVQQLLETLPDR